MVATKRTVKELASLSLGADRYGWLYSCAHIKKAFIGPLVQNGSKGVKKDIMCKQSTFSYSTSSCTIWFVNARLDML
jgi:hypothetical protein